MSSIRISDVDPIIRQARALGPDANKAANTAIMVGSKRIADAARPRIPRSTEPRKSSKKNGWRTGQHVADVLKAERVASSKYITGGVTTPGGVAHGSHFYLRFLEYGAKKRTKAGHYIGQTAESKASEVEQVIHAELKKGLGL